MALGKTVYSDITTEELAKLTPIQNNGTSAERIAAIAKSLIEEPSINFETIQQQFEIKQVLAH